MSSKTYMRDFLKKEIEMYLGNKNRISRIKSTILMAAILIIVVFLPVNLFQIIIIPSLAGLVGSEWYVLCIDPNKGPIKYSERISVIVSIVLVTLGISMLDITKNVVHLSAGIIILGIAVSLMLIQYTTTTIKPWLTEKQGSPKKILVWLIFSLGFIVQQSAWLCITQLQAATPMLLLWYIFLVCIADSMGYVVGQSTTSRKKIFVMSPNKTQYGTVGMLLSPVVISGFVSTNIHAFTWLIGILALIGDLWVSLVKRWADCKDTGDIIPGHGGLLDRVDSHIVIFALLVWFL